MLIANVRNYLKSCEAPDDSIVSSRDPKFGHPWRQELCSIGSTNKDEPEAVFHQVWRSAIDAVDKVANLTSKVNGREAIGATEVVHYSLHHFKDSASSFNPYPHTIRSSGIAAAWVTKLNLIVYTNFSWLQ